MDENTARGCRHVADLLFLQDTKPCCVAATVSAIGNQMRLRSMGNRSKPAVAAAAPGEESQQGDNDAPRADNPVTVRPKKSVKPGVIPRSAASKRKGTCSAQLTCRLSGTERSGDEIVCSYCGMPRITATQASSGDGALG
jgi:hypothetical protein